MSATLATAASRSGAHPATDIAASIETRIEELRGWNISSEAVYLAAGGELQLLHRRVVKVRDCIRRSTDAVATAKGASVESDLRAASRSALAAAALSGERGAALEQLSEAARSAAGGASEVALVFRLLDYVVLVARTHVEAMTEARDELGPFTHHVQELVEAGQRIARDLDARVRLLLASIQESREIATQLQIADDGESGDIASQFEALLARLAEHRAAAGAVRDAAQGSFGRIAEAVAGLVGGLQFHDIARQRLEHSLDNLARLKDEARRAGTADGAEAERAINAIARLETAQLAALSAIYDERMGHIQSVLAVIETEVMASDRLLASMFASNGENAGRSAIAVLEAEAGRVRARFRRGEKGRQRLNESLAACVEAARPLIGMTDELAELEHALRLAGFNAAVRAAHVDSGDETIGYIAREIRDQASIAKERADGVRAGIEAAVAATADLGSRILPAIAEAGTAVTDAFASALSTLGAIEAECLEQLREGATTANGLGGQVAAITRLMNPHVKGCGLMLSIGAALGRLAELCPAAPAGDGARPLLDGLAARYTMVEERDTFAAVFGYQPGATKAPAASDDLDDFLL